MSDFLSDEQLEGLDAYWRASNYLAVGQIYLKEDMPEVLNWQWTPANIHLTGEKS